MGNLTDDMTRLTGEISAMRSAREAFRNDLKRGVEGLKETVADMQAGFRNAHSEMAKNTKGELRAFISDVKKGVDGLRKDVSQMQARFQEERSTMAGETKADLLEFVSGINGFVSDLKETVKGLRQEFAFDLEGARRAWSGASPTERGAMEEAKFKAVKEEKQKAELFPDDLTAIQGIGPAIQRHLNEAGIHTYKQLADSLPTELRAALGKLGKVVDAEYWIAQARELETE